MNTIKERKFHSLVIDDNIPALTTWLSNQKIILDDSMLEKIFLTAAMSQSENTLLWCFNLSDKKASLLSSKNQFDNSGLWLLCPWATEKIISTIKEHISPEMLHFVGAQKSSPLLLAASHANWNMTTTLFEIYPLAAQHTNVDNESLLEKLLFPSYYHRNETAHFPWCPPPTDFLKKILDSCPLPNNNSYKNFPILIKARQHQPHLHLLWHKILELPKTEQQKYLTQNNSKITVLDSFIFSKDTFMIEELLKVDGLTFHGLSSSTIAFKHLDFNLATKVLIKENEHFSKQNDNSNIEELDIFYDPFQNSKQKSLHDTFEQIPGDDFSSEVLSLLKSTLTSSVDKEQKLDFLLNFFNKNILLLKNKFHQSLFPFALQNLDLQTCKYLLNLEPQLLTSIHQHEFLGPLEAAAKSNIDSFAKLNWLHSIGCKPLIINDNLWQNEAKNDQKHLYHRFINGQLMRQHLNHSYIYRITNDKTQQLNKIKENEPATLLSIDNWNGLNKVNPFSEEHKEPPNLSQTSTASTSSTPTKQTIQVHPDFLAFASKNNLVHAIDWLQDAGYEFNENQLTMATHIAIVSAAKEETLTRLWKLHKNLGTSPWNNFTVPIAYKYFSPQKGKKFNLPKFNFNQALLPTENRPLNSMDQAIEQICETLSFDLNFENPIPSLFRTSLSAEQKQKLFISEPDIPVAILWGHLFSNCAKQGDLKALKKLIDDLPNYAKLSFPGSPFSKITQKIINNQSEPNPQTFIETLKEQIFFEIDICAKKLLTKQGKIYSFNPLKESLIIKHKNTQYDSLLKNILIHKKNDNPELINFIYESFLKHATPSEHLRIELEAQSNIKHKLLQFKKDENFDVLKENLYLNTKNILENTQANKILISEPKIFSSFFSTLVRHECFQLAEHLLDNIPFGVDKNELAKSIDGLLSSGHVKKNSAFSSLCFKKIFEYSTFLANPQNVEDNLKAYKFITRSFEGLCRQNSNSLSESKSTTTHALQFLNNLSADLLEKFYKTHSQKFPEIALKNFVDVRPDQLEDPISLALNNGKTVLAKEILKKLPNQIIEEYRTVWMACFLTFLQKEISKNSDCLLLSEKEKYALSTIDATTLDVWHYEEPTKHTAQNKDNSAQDSDNVATDGFFLANRTYAQQALITNKKIQLFELPDNLSIFENKSISELIEIHKLTNSNSPGLKPKLMNIKNLDKTITSLLAVTILSRKFDDFIKSFPMTNRLQNTHALIMATKNNGHYYGYSNAKLSPEDVGWFFLHRKNIPFESSLNFKEFGQYFSKTKHPYPHLAISMPLIFALLDKDKLSLNTLATWKEAKFSDIIENLPQPVAQSKSQDNPFDEKVQLIPSNIRQYLSASDLSTLETFELETQILPDKPKTNKTIKHL